MALYFDHPAEAYEFLVKSDVDIRGALYHILNDYKRRKDEARMNLIKASLLERIRFYAESKKRRNLAFLEDYDGKMTREMLMIWLQMSKALEIQRNKMVEGEYKPLETSLHVEEDLDPFEKSRKEIEQRMREKAEEERRLQDEEQMRLRMQLMQQLIRSIQKNHAFLDCNRFYLNRLAREWRTMALLRHQKQKEIEQTVKIRPDSKSVFIKILEINQSVLSEPLLTLSLETPNEQTKPSFRLVLEKAEKGSQLNEKKTPQFGLKVSGQVKAVKLISDSKFDPNQYPQILWEIKNNAMSWHLGLSSIATSKVYSPKDVIEFTLSPEYEENQRFRNESNETIFKATIKVTDLLKESTPLKLYYLSLNHEQGPKKTGFLEPLIKFKVFLGDTMPHEQDWELDIVRDIKKTHFIRDPVYEEIIKLPKYTPKNTGFLIEILRSWGVFDIEMNYKRLIEDFKEEPPVVSEIEGSSPSTRLQTQPSIKKKLLQEIIENLYDFTIEETSRSHARSQGNLKRFLEFEEKATDFLNKQKPSSDPEYLNSEENEINSEERGGENQEIANQKKLLKLRSMNNGKMDAISLKLLESMCQKGGVPNHKRPFLWSFLGNVEEIKLKAVIFYNSSLKMNSYEKSSKPIGEDLNSEISLSSFYQKLLEMAQNSEVCQLVRQQIADDIALINESEDFANQELQDPMNNILSALAFLIDMLKSSNPQHLDPYKHIFYSMPIMKITRKIIAIMNSRYLDPEQMNLEAFKGNNRENEESPIPMFKKNQVPQSAFLEKTIANLNNNEFLAFWMLVSMVSHVLPGYFIGMPHELNKEIKTPLRESYQDEIGLKRDLLILKFYLKENEPAISQLFEDISLPLEFFYGNMLLSAGADMVHNEVLYRVWDLMYLQKEKDLDPHLILISLVILILKISKDHILRGYGKDKETTKHAAKDSREINDIIKIFETVSRFLPNPDEVIIELLKIQEDITKFMRQHYAEFNNLRTDLNNKFQAVRHQNKMFYDLIHHKNNFEELKENVGVFEIFKLLETLKRKHKLFQSSYQEDVELLVPQEFDSDDDPHIKIQKDLDQQLLWFKHFDLKNDPNIIIHLFLHKMTLFGSREELPFKLEIIYQGESKAILPLEFNTTCYLNHYLQIPYIYKGLHQITIQITLEREWIENLKSPKILGSTRDLGTNKTLETLSSQTQIPILKKFIIKEAIINLDCFMTNYLQKSIAKLDFTPGEIEINEDYNLTTSEVDFSLVLSTEHIAGIQENIENSFRNNAKLLAQSLPKPLFKVETFERIKEVNLERFHEKFLKSLINVLGLEHISNTAFAINPNEWRKNSKISYEDFRQTLKEAKFVEGVPLDYFALYNSIMNSNRDKTFYFTDFLILLILFSHTTPKQKTLLFYDTLMLFDNSKDLCNGISILTVKSMISYLYEVFMLSIPHHQVDNIIEFLTDGYVSGVISAKLDYKIQEKQEKIPMTLNFTNSLIHITNYLHYYYNTKQLFLGDPGKLSLLKEVLENLNEETRDILDVIPNNEFFRLNLKYRLRGMKHKMQILFDKNWDIKRKLVLDPEVSELKIQSPERYKLIENLLLQNENVIPLGNLESFLTKNQFILLMEKLPMMSYFLSFSIFENNVAKLPQVSCSIRLDNELIGHIENLSIHNLEVKAGEETNDAYKNLSYNWNQKRAAISDQRTKNYGAKPSSLKFDRFPYYEPFFNTLKLIQMKIMSTYLNEESIQGNVGGGIASSLINASNISHSSFTNKGKKAPEYSKIYDVDFRKVVFEMFCLDHIISGLFYYSLFDLAWLISQNLRGIRSGELKLVIKYFSKSYEKIGLIPRKPEIIYYDPFKRFEQKYQCLAIFFYSYQSKEWLSCKVVKRFFSKRKKEMKSPICSYYGVIFQKEPESNPFFILIYNNNYIHFY